MTDQAVFWLLLFLASAILNLFLLAYVLDLKYGSPIDYTEDYHARNDDGD